MRLKKFVAAAVCGAMLISGCGFAGISSHAEEIDAAEELEATDDTVIQDTQQVSYDEKVDVLNGRYVGYDRGLGVYNAYVSPVYTNVLFDGQGYVTDYTVNTDIPKCAPGYRVVKSVLNPYSSPEDNFETNFETKYKYNSNGDLIDIKGDIGSTDYEEIFEYNSDGRIIKHIHLFSLMRNDFSDYDFSNLENLDDLNDFEEETGVIISMRKFEYDSNGNLKKCEGYVEENDWWDGGNYEYVVSYEYDNNKLIKAVCKEDEYYECEFEYKYDSNDKLTEITVHSKYYQGKEAYETYKYAYDSNGNMTEEVYKDSIGRESKTTYTYDSYIYDSNGNLVKNGEMSYEYEYIGGSTAPTPTPAEPAAKEGYSSMYRLYNPNSGEHFYTADTTERDNLVGYGWRYEGIAWSAPETSDTPVYRLYNPNAGDHHYTTSEKEKDNLVSLGWKFEGIGWYSTGTDGQALYRLYNPNAKAAGSHHYTTSADERDNLVSLGWRDEGIAWYGGK